MSEVVSAELAPAKPELPLAPPQAPPQATTNDAPASPGRVAELRVSAHVMTLETGLYCVFPTPGSPDPDPATGLPGVRVTPAPGIAGRPEAVSVSTFREDGWLNGTAALVRVTDGSAQILVSVYQNMRQRQDAAPRLQVLRLSKEPNGAAASVPEAATARAGSTAPPAAAQTEPNPEIMAHVQRMGDVGGKIGDWIGVKGSRQWVEGFGLAPTGGVSADDIEYQGVLGRNWLSPWIEGGKDLRQPRHGTTLARPEGPPERPCGEIIRMHLFGDLCRRQRDWTGGRVRGLRGGEPGSARSIPNRHPAAGLKSAERNGRKETQCSIEAQTDCKAWRKGKCKAVGATLKQ